MFATSLFKDDFCPHTFFGLSVQCSEVIYHLLSFNTFPVQCGERKIQRLWNNHLQIDQFSPEGKTERNKKLSSSSYTA